MARRAAAAVAAATVPTRQPIPNGEAAPAVNVRLKLAIQRVVLQSGRPQFQLAQGLGMSPFRLSKIICNRVDATDDEKEQLAALVKESVRVLFPRVVLP